MSEDLATQLQSLQNLRARLGEAVYEQMLNDLREQYGAATVDALLGLSTEPSAPQTAQSGGVHMGSGNTVNNTGDIFGNDKVLGDKVGTKNVYHGEDVQAHRRRYLERLAEAMYHLPLRGIEAKLDHGEGVALPHVYVSLATRGLVEVARGLDTSQKIQRYFEDGDAEHLKDEYDPDLVSPGDAIIRVELYTQPPKNNRGTSQSGHILYRSLLATEAVQHNQRLVLLGDPGSGKSTFLRHMCWALARAALDGTANSARPAWDAPVRPLPVFVSLRRFAGHIAEAGIDTTAITDALCDAMSIYGVTAATARALMDAAHDDGRLLLLFDGLDEVPMEGVDQQVVDRQTTMQAVRVAARCWPRANMVVTCRTRAFDVRLHDELGWHGETLARFTLGQMRHFIPAWFAELVTREQITAAQAERLGEDLLTSLLERPRLRELAQTPLLLTLMAVVLYNDGTLPRDRPQLYERVLTLLLGQWDKTRDGESLADVVGQPEWGSERFQPLLDRLSYEAHRDAMSEDGRGRLARGTLYTALIDFFKSGRVRSPGDAALRCLDYFEHRSGLLVADESDSYVFAHLTLQEHCAARYIAVATEDPVNLALQHRADDRWREPIMLCAGLLRPADLHILLDSLIDTHEANTPKPVDRWQRDLLMAAEIGKDRDWSYLQTLPLVRAERLQENLRYGLAELLNDATQPLPVAERVRAGFLLGELGDPRFPVTRDEWRAAWAKAQRGDPSGYFCCVDAGTYTIGSADDDPNAQDDEKPQHTVSFDAPFWIGRLPVTNAQWQAWVAAGGETSRYDDNSNLNHANQPVVAITWSMCNDFCTWLSTQLDMNVRLPTEQEWEAAARGGAARRYPWGDAWQDDHAATEEDQQTRGANYTTPVGCYAAGAAPCGALDMAGNVREWTASAWQSYPGAEEVFTDQELRVLRGGYFASGSTNVRCGARDRSNPLIRYDNPGVRVVVAPRAH